MASPDRPLCRSGGLWFTEARLSTCWFCQDVNGCNMMFTNLLPDTREVNKVTTSEQESNHHSWGPLKLQVYVWNGTTQCIGCVRVPVPGYHSKPFLPDGGAPGRQRQPHCPFHFSQLRVFMCHGAKSSKLSSCVLDANFKQSVFKYDVSKLARPYTAPKC